MQLKGRWGTLKNVLTIIPRGFFISSSSEFTGVRSNHLNNKIPEAKDSNSKTA